MEEKVVKEWKKVLISDLSYVVDEVKDELETPALLILTGEVGAGKTTFTSFFLEDSEFGSSPSYSLVNEYRNMAHADFYRLKDKEEIIHLELSLYLENKDYFIIEWGKEYLDSIAREIGDTFHAYELTIDINEPSESLGEVSRNYSLAKIKYY